MTTSKPLLTNNEYVQYYINIATKINETLKLDDAKWILIKYFDMINLSSNNQNVKNEVKGLKTALSTLIKYIKDEYTSYKSNYTYSTSSNKVTGSVSIESLEKVQENYVKVLESYERFFNYIPIDSDINLKDYLETFFGVEITCIFRCLYISIIENIQVNIPSINKYILDNTKGNNKIKIKTL